MKGIKITLDTKVQPNLIQWRHIYGYDKSVDAIVYNVGKGSCRDAQLAIPNPVVGDVYTISFDAWGDTQDNWITTHMIPLNNEDIIAFSAGDNKAGDNGHVDWLNLSEKSKRYFATYRLIKGANGVIIRSRPGTTYIRNVKLEKSPYPTDYEGISKTDDLGGGNS